MADPPSPSPWLEKLVHWQTKRPFLVLALVLALAVLALFVWGLGLPLHALPRLG